MTRQGYSIPIRLIVAGLLAGLAYLAAMALDLALAGNRTNDLQLLSGMIPGQERRWRSLGALMHFGNSVALAVVFARVRGYLPGRGWMRGLIFGQLENLTLYPLVVVIGRFHPAVKSGRLDHYARPLPMLQEIARHAAFGAVLGALLDDDER